MSDWEFADIIQDYLGRPTFIYFSLYNSSIELDEITYADASIPLAQIFTTSVGSQISFQHVHVANVDVGESEYGIIAMVIRDNSSIITGNYLHFEK